MQVSGAELVTDALEDGRGVVVLARIWGIGSTRTPFRDAWSGGFAIRAS